MSTHRQKLMMELNELKKQIFTSVKVKLSVVICIWVKTRDAVLDSQDPDTLIRLGIRFTKSWTVCV